MENVKLSPRLEKIINDFVKRLKNIYADELISVVLYGSASSGEYVPRHSNVNLAVILKDAGLRRLSKVSGLILGLQVLNPVFFTEDHIKRSVDVFPIEFLDMKENHILIYGIDFLKGINIDTKNLRFQCEQELKSKIVNLKRAYLKSSGREALQQLLLTNFTSAVHILRNVIRLKGHKPAYEKEEILNQVSRELDMDMIIFAKIWKLKREKPRLSYEELENLFFAFADDLEKIAESIDRL